MKTKVFILLALSAVITLSFTFASVRNHKKETPTAKTVDTPSGGFASEDKF